MPKPTQAEIDAWQVTPPLKPWQEAFGRLDEALAEHPALKGKPLDKLPTLWCDAGWCALRAPSGGIEYRITSPRWHQGITNPRMARIVADELITGLREAIRSAKPR